MSRLGSQKGRPSLLDLTKKQTNKTKQKGRHISLTSGMRIVLSFTTTFFPFLPIEKNKLLGSF